jgi:hypothetical protein
MQTTILLECCWNCNEYGDYQSDCPQKKKMHGTQMSEVEEDEENEDGTASTRFHRRLVQSRARVRSLLTELRGQ